MAFELHPQLAKDSIPLGGFPLCRLLLMNDANYPWLILVPEREGVREIHELSESDLFLLMHESALLGRVMQAALAPDKLNIAALGNVVPQLHIHHIARYRNDPAWPAPVWGKLPTRAYTPEQVAEMRAKMLEALSGAVFIPA